jgi:hypothetical protein
MKNKFINWLCSKNGNAIAISLSLTSFLVVVSIGASTIILSSSKSSKNVEKYNNAFLVAESGIESALYEVSFHSSGYEVSHNYEETDHSRINFDSISASESWWETDSRTSMSSGNTTISIPSVDGGNSSADDDWNESSFGESKVIQLYADNSSCSSSSGKDCDWESAYASGADCIEHSRTFCAGNELHWFDSCDNDEGSYGCTNCTSGRSSPCCESAVCNELTGEITWTLACTSTEQTTTCPEGCDASTNTCN